MTMLAALKNPVILYAATQTILLLVIVWQLVTMPTVDDGEMKEIIKLMCLDLV